MFYSKIVNSKAGKKHPETLFYLGQAQKNNQKYTEAIATFGKFKKKASALSNKKLSKLYKMELAGCQLALDSTEAKVQTKSLGDQVPIIGVGGINSAQDALEKMEAGADLVQVYSGFIYEGPKLVKRINS